MLLRLIDDYLYITTSLPNAKGFLDVMKKGKYVDLVIAVAYNSAF